MDCSDNKSTHGLIFYCYLWNIIITIHIRKNFFLLKMMSTLQALFESLLIGTSNVLVLTLQKKSGLLHELALYFTLYSRDNFSCLSFQVPFLFGLAAIEKLASLIIHWILRRTGEHLFMTDDDGGKPPLVQRMIEDQGEYYFM